MTAFMRHNRRPLGWLLTLAMVALAASAGASWQCFRGGPCPVGMHDAMPVAGPAPASTPAAGHGRACCCPSKASCLALPERGGTTALSRGSCCMLQLDQKPDTRSEPTPMFVAASAAAVVPDAAPCFANDGVAPAAPRSSSVSFRDACRALIAPRAPPACS